MMLFGLGKLFYVILLLINAVAVLSEERFLRRSEYHISTKCFYEQSNKPILTRFFFPKVGLGSNSNQGAVFGQQESTTKSKLVQLISAVQTLLRSMYRDRLEIFPSKVKSVFY